MNTVAEYSTEEQTPESNVPTISLRHPVPAQEDMIVDDIILWTEDVYEEEGEGVEHPRDRKRSTRWRWLGKRTVKAVVEWGFSIGPAKTRLVHVRVQASTGYKALPARKRVPRTVSKLKRCKVLREAWVCEAQRAMARRRTMNDAKMAKFRVRQVDHIIEKERPRLADCTQNTLPRSVRRAHPKKKKNANKTKAMKRDKDMDKKPRTARPGQFDRNRRAHKQGQARRKHSQGR